MKNNNPNIMKTLKSIDRVIGTSPFKNNNNNSSKERKKYDRTIESHYYEKNKSYSSVTNHKSYKKEENKLRLFQKKVFFRKWLYRLRLKFAQDEYIQKKNRVKSNNKKKSELQFICYSDHFRIPPKHYVDRMRRTLPNFDFNHIEEARTDKDDLNI